MKEELKRPEFVWQGLLRWFHWVTAICITTLILTGLYIGNPFVIQVDPSVHIMGWIRDIHFIAAYVLIAHLLLRVYLLMAGNQFAKSNPLSKRFWVGVWTTLKHYMFIGEGEHTAGHNSLAQLSYWLFIGVGGLIQILTGLAMEGEPYANSWRGQWLEWLRGVLGTDDVIHYIHHLMTWAFVLFILIHLYVVFREDNLEKSGEVSSMFTGYKLKPIAENKKRVE